ncbi:uncharacterized protein VTP21DRAFT_5570 [Calcarisporiella thermophila]|uniref:uncharacterized protein n=1 Tax=Calcarisporiella thermophila TaxID=911321 RepID=UPI0037447368
MPLLSPCLFIPEEGTFTLLGIPFNTKHIFPPTSFYEQLLEKLEKTVKTWKSRSISLLGKVLLVNSRLLSKIWYLAYLIPFKQDFFDRVSRIVQQFLWGGRRSQIERSLLEQPKGFGLGLIDPKHQCTAILASWIQRIHNAQRERIPPPWYHLAIHILTKHYPNEGSNK